MTADEFDKVLERTKADRKLTGSEKRSLEQLLKECAADEQRLAFFRHRAFEVAATSMTDRESKELLNWLEDVIKVLTPKPDTSPRAVADACFSPQDDCPGRICSLLDRCTQSVDICVFTITDDRISSSIRRTHQRGIDVRIITDNEKMFDAGSDIQRLQGAGIPVRVDRSPFHMHHKFAIFDRKILLTGSYNWTRGASMNNEENFIVTDESRLVARFRQLFEQLWTQFDG